jgi:argininosuccinate lyase
MAHLWSGRFAGDPDAELFTFGSSFRFDRRLFEDDVRGSRAWAAGLARAGVLSAPDAAAIEQGLQQILQTGLDDPGFVTPDHGDEDVHAFVERELIARIGDAGRRLHTGRSRNEQVAVDLRLYLKRRIPDIQRTIADTIARLVELAGRAGDALMPSYTHLRRAQPVLVAHFLLSHCAALRRDVDRLAAVLHEVDELPLGSGAIAGTSYAIDVNGLAASLGFGRIARNSIDVSGDRDFVASLLHAASLGMVHLSRIAEDFILFTSEEFGFFELSDAAATGSSLMPQKKNPDPLELVRGKSGRVIGHLTGWLVTMKGLPAGYNKDLQEDKEALFDTEDTWIGCLRAVSSVIGGLEPNAAASTRAASGLLLATDVADYLVAKGLPFRDAHEVVGALVRRLLDERRSFDDLSLEDWRRHSPLFGEDVRQAITALASD